MNSALAVLLGLSFSVSAHAKPADIPACSTIVSQCEAAGFEPGDHKKNGKGLWVDCVHAVAKGKSVTGVTVAQADAKACQEAAKAAHQAKKEK